MGNSEQNRSYCTKEPRLAGPVEIGEAPNQGRRSDLHTAVSLTRAGKIAEVDDVTYAKYHKGLMAVQDRCLTPRNPEDPPPEVFWYWGETGTGKSKAAWAKCEGKTNYWVSDGKWWCGYAQQEVVVLDDFRPDWMSFSRLLRLLDRYPYRVEWKGSGCWVKSKTFVFTAPHDPRRMFEGKTDEAIAQLLRRITEVVHFNVPLGQ